MIGRARKRKPWEFTWDDAGETAIRSGNNRIAEPSPVASQASEVMERRLDDGEAAIELRRAAPERRSRKRKAWEFTWDDREDAGLSAGSSPAAARQASSSDIGEASTDAQGVSASSSRTPAPAIETDGVEAVESLDIADVAAREVSPPSPKPRRRRLAARKASAEGAQPETSAPVPASPLPSGMSAEVPREPLLDSMDVDRVRQQLLALGQPGHDGKPASAQDEVSWIRPRRSRHEVQVVHVRSGAKRPAQEAADTQGVDSSLRTDPLIENALRVVSLLRGNHEDENVIALRRAVRELREQVAGLEAQAYAKPTRPEIPLFKQVYDPKTRMG
jgi:hypothetical protein